MVVNSSKVHCICKRFIQVNKLPVFQLVLTCGYQPKQYFVSFDSFSELQEYAEFLEKNLQNKELPESLLQDLAVVE